MPLLKPLTVMGLIVLNAVLPPGEEVAVYPVIALPPFEAGVVKVTLALVLPGVAETMPGMSGTVAGMTLFDGAEGALLPTELLAVTVKV